jgi:signal transduction histidine kinase
MQDFVLEDVVKECIDQVQETSEKHTIVNKLVSRSHIYADPDRTSQVILNLLINAIKYSPNSDKIIVTSESKPKSVKICIQDFGIGIRKSQQKKIFRQYYQVSDNKKENFPGIGLGLYLSAYFVRRVNGKIWVESEINKGSTFCVEFPLNKKKIANEKNTDSRR